jgi:hypothetical protein
MDGTDNSYFPIEVILDNKDIKIFERPDDIPEGIVFKVLRTKAVKPKGSILNTGIPNVGSFVDG